MKLFYVFFILAVSSTRSEGSCKFGPNDDFNPSLVMEKVCQLEEKIKKLSKRVDELTDCCNKQPPQPPQPPPPPPTKPPVPEHLSSCKDLKAAASWLTENKAYTLTSGGQKYLGYCHMGSLTGCGAGPWTLVIKANGNARTFHWNSQYWLNKVAYNIGGGRTGLDGIETKLPSYWGTRVTSVCLGMKYGGAIQWIKLDRRGTSLHFLIADGRYRATHVGRNTWKSLISGSSLQPFCNREGFNAQAENPPAAKARIGLIANDADRPVCRSCDSFIGIGTSYPAYGPMDADSCGNESIFNGDRGAKSMKAFGYVFVQ